MLQSQVSSLVTAILENGGNFESLFGSRIFLKEFLQMVMVMNTNLIG